MFRNIVFSAFGAGVVVCIVLSVLQFVTTEPLILHAEQFEGGAGGADHNDVAAGVGDHALAGADDAEEWRPADGLQRALFATLANLLIGVAVSLILLASMTLRGGRIDARHGLLWGVAGFVAVSLLPALGLPPELPGTPVAALFDRQAWWLATAVASAGGIALIAFGGHWAARAAGVVILVLPHAIGAPAPPSQDVAYPGALAGEFVVASLVVSAVLWTLAGASAGWLHRRLTQTA